MKYSTLSLAVVLASMPFIASAEGEQNKNYDVSQGLVFDNSDFAKPTSGHNINYFSVGSGNALKFSGSSVGSGELTVRNNDNDRVDTYFNVSGKNSSVVFNKFKTLNILVDSKFTHYPDIGDDGKDKAPNNQTPFIITNGGHAEISDIQTVNFGLKDNPAKVDYMTNLWGSGSSLVIKNIENFNSITNGSGSVLVQADSSISFDDVKNIYITNVYSGTSAGARAAVQLFCSSSGDAVQPASFSITNAENVYISGTDDNDNPSSAAAGIVINDRGGNYQGTKAANFIIQAKTLAVHGSDLGIYLTRKQSQSGSTNIQLSAEESLSIDVDADSNYGDAIRLSNETGLEAIIELNSPQVFIQGDISSTRGDTSIIADQTLINGSIKLNDGDSSLILGNRSVGIADVVLSGNVESNGIVDLKGGSINSKRSKIPGVSHHPSSFTDTPVASAPIRC